MNKEKTKLEGFTTRAIVVGVIWMLVMIVLIPWIGFLSPWTNRKFEWPHNLLSAGPPEFSYRNYWYIPLVVTLYPIIVNKIMPKKLKLTSWELAFVCSMLMPIVGIMCQPGLPKTITALYAALTTPSLVDFVKQYSSPLLGPLDLEAWAGFKSGGAIVPWSEWLLPMAWYMGFFISFFAFLIFISGLFRRLWVDIEFLDFPLANTISTFIKEASSKTSEKSVFKSAFLWIGVLYGSIFMLCSNNPQITGFESIPLLLDFTQIAGITGVFLFVINPWSFGLGFFLPDNVLVTGFVSYILMYMILPWALWVPLGFLEPLPPGRPSWWTFNRFIGMFEFYPATPLRGGYMSFSWGILIGLALYPLFFNWKYFKEIFKAILGKKVKWEDEEALPYRYMWWGAFASAIVFLIVTSAANLPIQYGIITLLLAGIFHIGFGRLQAETGWGSALLGGWAEHESMPLHFMMWPLGLTDLPTEGTAYQVMADMLVAGGGFGARGMIKSCPVGYTQDSYKLGSNTGAKNRHLMISQFIVYIAAVVIGIPLFLWLYYTYGTDPTGFPGGGSAGWMFAYRAIVEKSPYNPAWTPNAGLIGNFIWGVIFVFLLHLLRAKIGGIFNYASAAAVIVMTSQGINVWLGWLLAWLIKLIVRKIGGTPLLSKITTPLGMGLLMAGNIFLPIALVSNWIISMR